MPLYSRFSVDLTGALDAYAGMQAVPGRIVNAQKRALGTLKRRLLTEARRDIQTEYNLKASTIKDRLHIDSRMIGIVLRAKATGINLMNFSARQTRAGVTYSVNKGRREVRAHAFIRSTRSGRGPFVWLRKDQDGDSYKHQIAGKAAARFNGHGYPIFQQFGPSVAQMLKHGRRPERLAEFAVRILAAEQQRLLGSK